MAAAQRPENILFTTFYTPTYGVYARKWEDSLAALGRTLPYRAERLPARGWDAAVRNKPAFIAGALARCDRDWLCWVDADAIFRRVPELPADCDVSWHEFKRVPRQAQPDYLTGTLLFRDTEQVRAFVDDWARRTSKLGVGAMEPEQVTLRDTWKDWKGKLRWADLGPENVFIHDDFRKVYPDVEPAIEHFQASRQMRYAK